MTAWRVQQSGPHSWAVLRPNPNFAPEDPARCGSWLIVAERPTEAEAYALAWQRTAETPEATPWPGKRDRGSFHIARLAAPVTADAILSRAESRSRPYGRRKL